MILDTTGTGLTRREPPNHFNYTEDQLTEKKLALKQMKELWNDVPEFYAELVYDLCKNSSQEEIDSIKEKVNTTPSKYRGLETASLRLSGKKE